MAQPWDTALLATDGSNQIPPWYKMWKNWFVSAKVQASTLKRSWCREASAVLAAVDVAQTWVCTSCHTSGVHRIYIVGMVILANLYMDAIFTHLQIPTALPSIQNHPPNRGLPKSLGFVYLQINKTCSN